MEDEKVDLLVDEKYKPILVESECQSLKTIIEDFVKAYAANPAEPVETWLVPKMQELLPERSHEEIVAMVQEITVTVDINEEKKASLEAAIADGRSKESWFASETKKAVAGMSTKEAAKYLQALDEAVQHANESLYQTISTQAGTINQNPHLDGLIAEQYHAQTFNMNAEASGSTYRAEVRGSNGKNSVDIVIKDANGKIVRRYQSKYCKDAQSTERAFEHGDYRGQRKLVPKDQKGELGEKTVDVLEAPDGTTSNPLSKDQAKQLQEEAQSGNWNDLNWDEYAVKDLALGIGKQACYAGIQGAAISAGFDVAQKLYNGEEIKSEEVVEAAIAGGVDTGVKAAAAGALKVGSEKGIIGVIPKGTPAGTIATIACVAVENVKVLGRMADGQLTMQEGLEKMEQTTVATVAGISAMSEGTAIGAAVGSVLGPVGAAVGGFVGGTIGYMAGSKVGETVVKVAQKIRHGAVKVAKAIAKTAVSAVKSVASAVGSLCRGVASFFGF